MTAMLSGTRSTSRMESLSSTSGSSKGMPGGLNGVDPVATRMNALVIVRGPVAVAISTVCGSRRRAVPWR